MEDATSNSNLKRRRPDESRDEDLYFEDGSVVISANNVDGDLVYFKVHKSVLAKQSTVFKDMFSLPSPSDIDTYDGLPLVHVHDDAKDFKQFLQAIYDPSFLPFSRLCPDTPTMVLCPLKLANKYQADVLRNRITAHAGDDCPTTLYDWDNVAYSNSAKSDPSDVASQSESCLDHSDHLTKDFLPDPISYMDLARECNLPATFATLSYSLCRKSTTQKEKLSRMPKRDLEILFLGKDRMMHFISTPAADQLEITSWSEDVYDGYDSGINCRGRGCQLPLFKAWSILLQNVMCDGDPLATFREATLKCRKDADAEAEAEAEAEDPFEDYGSTRDEICLWCKYRLADKLEDLRQDLFDKLPFFFPLQEVDPKAA